MCLMIDVGATPARTCRATVCYSVWHITTTTNSMPICSPHAGQKYEKIR